LAVAFRENPHCSDILEPLSVALDLATLADIPGATHLSFSHRMKHGVSKKPICFRLIPTAIGLEPGNDVRVETYGDGLFRRPIELADIGMAESTTARASEKLMSSPVFASITRMSRFCSFVSFVIGFPFVGLGGLC